MRTNVDKYKITKKPSPWLFMHANDASPVLPSLHRVVYSVDADV